MFRFENSASRRIAALAAGLGLCLLAALPAAAQTKPAAGQPAAQPSAQPAAQPPAPPPEPVRTEILKFDNWTVTCQEFTQPATRKACVGQLQVVRAQTGQVVFALRVSYTEPNAPGGMAAFQTPTGILLTKGVSVKFGKLEPRLFTLTSCEPTHCLATVPLDATLLRDLSANEAMEVTVFGSNGEGLKFAVPIKGFDRANAALKR